MISPHGDDVEVGMGDAEAGDGVADALWLQCFLDAEAEGFADAEEVGGEFVFEIDEVIDVGLWQDDGMALPDGPVIEDREGAIILVKFPSGDVSPDDFAEDAGHDGELLEGAKGMRLVAASFRRS